MKKLLAFILSLFLLLSSCCAESSLHSLWEINQNMMNVQQVHDYLENNKGIVSSIVWNYDRRGHNSINSLDGQALSLFGFPFSFHYTEYEKGNFINIIFDRLPAESDAKALAMAFIDFYGFPDVSFYDLYNKSDYEWDHNIREPMYHERALITDFNTFCISDTLEYWEHFEVNKYMWGQISITLYIDNIEVSIKHSYEGNYLVTVTFYSFIPKLQIDEVVETRNISNYVDTGL